jgi:hypothetical protein
MYHKNHFLFNRIFQLRLVQSNTSKNAFILITSLHPSNMKNLFIATCIAAGISLAPAANAGPGDGAYSQAMMARATTLTRALAQRIHFNEAQYLAVKQLHLEMLTERRDLEILLNGASAEERDTQLAIAQLRYETELTNLFQPQQLVAYQALRNNFTAHRLK